MLCQDGSIRGRLLCGDKKKDLEIVRGCWLIQTCSGKMTLQHVCVKPELFQILMTTSSFFLLTSVFFLIFSTVPGFQNATRDMFGVGENNFSVVLKDFPGRYRRQGCWRNTFSKSDRGHFRLLVHAGVSHQIHCLSSQGLRSSFGNVSYFISREISFSPL